MPEPRRLELIERTGLDDGELQCREEVSRALHVPFHEDVISRLQGHGNLIDVRLPDRAVCIRPGETCRLPLPE
ncbi:hypothetical protein ACFYZJ_10260 [Streptomyces sp. NPDC001848]|uniref:hypothetical protein n=1 Tax=Streptomyces sp. NPDC001848 TaxID=3364618 RepID=UPI0036880E38